ncbi:hypothetical protein GY45DRAFT_1371639 [Cubamyces sp. BRFM 1775]|nr:hypothetical protein GY45DRAFT_1371639 [Cubamyces sp. BRFM 1775]
MAPQAPIERLPVELLSYIFILGAHTPDPQDFDSESDATDGERTREGHEPFGEDEQAISPCIFSSSTPPDVFAAVNRHWREVALGTPKLWTRICVTIGDLQHNTSDGGWFPAVSRYVSRSRRCPLDIYIDARDPEWDFSEDDMAGAVVSPYFDDSYGYVHPFRVEHVHYVLNILLPHVARIRSLAILTDRWAPMQTALQCLSFQTSAFVSAPDPLPSGLPLLESLVLMRCNEFVSYHDRFSPHGQQGPAYLPFRGLLTASCDGERQPAALLPNLRQLVLSGVHLDWSSLPYLLPTPHDPDGIGLKRLELSYHSAEVRPDEQQLRRILQKCQSLRTLTVQVSGPHAPEASDTCRSADDAPPIALPALKTLKLGYYDVQPAVALLGMVDLGTVENVALEYSYPGRDETLDGEPLLLACSAVTSTASSRYAQPVFPRARSVALRRVEASAETFKAFYAALPSLRELSVAQMFLLGGESLMTRDVDLSFVPPEATAHPFAPEPSAANISEVFKSWTSVPEACASATVGRTIIARPDASGYGFDRKHQKLC